MTRDDGGYAFPWIEGHEASSACYGMTLRDYFAAQALPNLASMRGESNRKVPGAPGDCKWEPDVIASWCYQLADAMLAERAK